MVDRVTPVSNPPAERALVGLAFVRPQAQDEAAVGAEEFELPLARAAWASIGELRRRGCDVTPISLREVLGGHTTDPQSIVTLLGWAQDASFESPRALGAIVRKTALARRLASFCAQASQELQTPGSDPERILGEHRAAVLGIETTGQAEPVALSEALHTALEAIEERARMRVEGGVVAGLRTGICAYDDAIGGYRPGQQVVVAARPGGGKSAYALQVITHMALVQKVPCLLLSLEMTVQEQVERLLSGFANVPATAMGKGDLGLGDWQRISSAASKVAGIPLYVCDRSMNLDKYQAAVRSWHSKHVKHGQHAVFVTDYLGLVVGSRSSTREQEVAGVSKAGKLLAKELGATSVMVAQLSRRSEQEGRLPNMSDLRESGQIEADADVIVFPHRDQSSEDNEGCGQAQLIVAKNRGGRTGVVSVWWNGPMTRYEDAERAA